MRCVWPASVPSHEHALVLIPSRSAWECDICSTSHSMADSAHRFRCSSCDYDLCRHCLLQQLTLLSVDLPSIVPAPSPPPAYEDLTQVTRTSVDLVDFPVMRTTRLAFVKEDGSMLEDHAVLAGPMPTGPAPCAPPVAQPVPPSKPPAPVALPSLPRQVSNSVFSPLSTPSEFQLALSSTSSSLGGADMMSNAPAPFPAYPPLTPSQQSVIGISSLTSRSHYPPDLACTFSMTSFCVLSSRHIPIPILDPTSCQTASTDDGLRFQPSLMSSG
jgi:hypothetical protein